LCGHGRRLLTRLSPAGGSGPAYDCLHLDYDGAGSDRDGPAGRAHDASSGAGAGARRRRPGRALRRARRPG